MRKNKTIFSADDLRQVGEALYGEHWQSALARDLNVSTRRVRAWLAGEWLIPPSIWTDIVKLLLTHKERIERILGCDKFSALVRS